MKRISIYFLFAFASFKGFAQDEWVRASIDNGAAIGTTGLYISSNTEFDANKCDNIVFTVRVPISAGPSVTISETYHDASIAHISFAIQKLAVTDGAYYYYLVNGTGTVQAATGTIYNINTPYRLLELSYAGGVTNGVVQLANIENDIPGNTFIRPQFYIQINTGDITNYSSMFYGSGTALPVNNQAITGDDFVGTSAAVALPVRFLSFEASKRNNDADLSWSVQNESLVTDHYEIERSINGTTFDKIGTVPAKNNGNSSNTYALTDQRIDAIHAAGTIYYKVRQVDKDGRFIISETRQVSLNGKLFNVSVFPNPVISTGVLNIDLEVAGSVHIILIDATGKEVQHAILNGLAGLNVYKLNMEKLASGAYIVNVIAGKESKSLPVVKKK